MAAPFKGPLDYIDVATRIVEFRTIYPTGSLQQLDLQFIDFAGKSWVVYTAAAYRTPDDERPGVGTAWEPVPGTTNFTRDSELQNAETAAWGRAMVAALAVDTKKGIASAEEIRNRQEATITAPTRPLAAAVTDALKAKFPDSPEDRKAWVEAFLSRKVTTLATLSDEDLTQLAASLAPNKTDAPSAPETTNEGKTK